jgi:uncharacterized surface protein with fasciclin (FAS1) repeats
MKGFHRGRPQFRAACMRVGLALPLLVLAPSALRAQAERPALNNAVSTGRIFGYLQILRLAGVSVESLTSEDVTLILPIDTTFYELPPDHYQRIFSPDNRDLALKYVQAHMIRGKVTLQQLAEGNYRTVAGIEIKAVLGGLGEAATINGCKVVRADIVGTRGTVHLIAGWLFRP